MNYVDEVENAYFEWIYDLCCKDKFPREISYRKLFTDLHNIEFYWIIPNDYNRASDGKSLRRKFEYRTEYTDASDVITGSASVLEVMVALAWRIEDDYKSNDDYGDRTKQWFWYMVHSLGLWGQDDNNYDRDYVYERIELFMNREYDANGQGSLFYLPSCKIDLTKIEIWGQMQRYLNTLPYD